MRAVAAAAAAASGLKQRRRFLQAQRREGAAKGAEKVGSGSGRGICDPESSIVIAIAIAREIL